MGYETYTVTLKHKSTGEIKTVQISASSAQAAATSAHAQYASYEVISVS